MAERVQLRGGSSRFRKGKPPGPGRPKGVPNKTTYLLREAILEACTLLGKDSKGKDGLVGYLMRIGDKNPDLMVQLLGRVLPMQLVGTGEKGEVQVTLTLPQLEERMRQRGLPLVYDPPMEMLPAPKVINGQSNGHAV